MTRLGAGKRYDREFKLGVVRLVIEEGRPPAGVAKELGVSLASVHQWVRAYKEDPNRSFPGSGKLKPQDEEMRKLREELRVTRMERDILKKTIAFFADRPK